MYGFVFTLVWAVLLGLILLLPTGPQGDTAIRNSIRLALVCYGFSLAVQLQRGSGQLARLTWTLSWLTYAVHVILAFHHFHHWSHAHAVEHVRQASGFGEGIYASHLFGLLWTMDVVWWWLSPRSHAARPGWMTFGLHGFMLFMVFNATIVFETGIGRWLGVGLFLLLAWMWRTRSGADNATTPGN